MMLIQWQHGELGQDGTKISEANVNIPLGCMRYQRKIPQSSLHEELQCYLGDSAKYHLGITAP